MVQLNNYNLEERTAKFGEEIIDFCRNVKYQDIVIKPIVIQLVRFGTSIGANYMEANGASSKKDFRNKIFICKKEAQETKHWLRMIKRCILLEEQNKLFELQKECQELIMIFQKITTTLSGSK